MNFIFELMIFIYISNTNNNSAIVQLQNTNKQDLLSKILFAFNRILRKQTHVNLLQFHIIKKTKPSHLLFLTDSIEAYKSGFLHKH